MSIRVQCINCSKSLAVHDRFEGRQLKCPACGTQQRVPKKSQADQRWSESINLGSSHGSTASDATESVAAESPISKDEERTPGKGDRRSPRDHHSDEELEWDITPMVDVAFLLLIFFMLTAAFSVQKAIPASAKQEGKSARREITDPQEMITIQIDELNTYTVVSSDGEVVEASNKQDLIIQLDELVRQLGDVSPRVLIKAHALCIHGSVVSCMDAARQAGFASFQMQSVEEFD